MKVVLATLHSRYIHASLALPCLAAAASGIEGVETVLREYTVNEPAAPVLRDLAAQEADLVAFSCYIWNVEQTARLASDLKRVRPGTLIAIGGPEVSHTAEDFLKENESFDFVIRGEGEAAWVELVSMLKSLNSWHARPDSMPAGITYRMEGVIAGAPDREPIADLDQIPSPFAMGLVDTAKPLVYYETSRGCPFSCAFCLSSLEKGVRSFSPGRIRQDLEYLMGRGVSVVKLVDRTFNYDPDRADGIWQFILERNSRSRFHFEIAADLLTERNLETLRQAPPGMFRFEIGVQATGSDTLARVGRKSDTERLFSNVRRLMEETGVTVHLDLVAGLPGEDFRGFLGSLEKLFQVGPHHIQVEPLKVLKGSPMAVIAAREGYAWSATPPYKILTTPDLSFVDICRIEDMARLLDIFHNSGRFSRSLAVASSLRPLPRFFNDMARFLDKSEGSGKNSLKDYFDLLWNFATSSLNGPGLERFRDALRFDYCLVEYPAAGALPACFRDGEPGPREKTPKETLDSLLKTVEIPSGSRVRTFTARFDANYSVNPPPQSPIELAFIYVSAPGKGLSVHVLPLNSST